MDTNLVEQIAVSFVELRRVILADLSKRLAADLSAAQSELLLCVQEGPINVKDVASAMNVTSGAITQLVDQLEDSELIERFMNEDDRRVVWIKLSEAGHKRLAKIKKLYTKHFMAALYGFSQDELESLSLSLQKIVANAKDEDF